MSLTTTLECAFVGGRRINHSGDRSALVDPVDGKPWIEVTAASAAETAHAVETASAAFGNGAPGNGWGRSSSAERSRALFGLATLIEEHAEELAQLESRNVGKPIREARDEAALAARCYRYYAGAADKAAGATLPVAAGGLSLTLREPLGVCGLIIPWNFPMVITAWKTAPALALGNTVVVKPATLTPLTALRLAELATQAGVPDGVFNVVPGSGAEAGETLVRHPAVRKISFTGSTEVGVGVMRAAADGIKRVTLELGGKSANIVFADADFERAADAAVWSVLGNAGQDCCARSRLLVERPLYDRFVEAVAERFANLRLGLPHDASTEIGPLVSVAHRDAVAAYIDAGKSEGARLVCGGGMPQRFAQGAWLEPALFADTSPRMKIVREEIFGPVLAAMPFDKEDEAVSLANDTTYGLSGSVWTADLGRGVRVARRVRTGVISVNSASSVHLEAPFGGVGSSGLGRELGMAALDSYSETKSVYIDDSV